MDNFSDERKIPGMCYILVSFIPWIVYWVLCGMGYTFGALVPLMISLFLIFPQIRRKDFNLMDVTSVSYFSITSVVTFVLKSEIFVDKSGFLGYSALFLMAFFSILVRRPYTLQVSKRDYPEVYWRDKSFLAINNLITILWVCVFLLNAVLFLFLLFPFTVILSNIFIICGIVFSIVFPLKAPAYFASKDFKKYDWNVKVDSQRLKDENEYDVIIVGSGIGGLTCGGLLSKRGFRVLILEQHRQVGGYCSSFKRKGFIFNSGVIDVGGLGENGPVAYVLKELGLKKEDFFVRNTVKYILKGREIRIMDNLDDTVENLSELFPDEKEGLRRFFSDVKTSYTECYKEAEIYGAPLPPELLVKVFGGKKLLDYPKDHPCFYSWLDKTFQEKLDEYFTDEGLKSFLGGLAAYTGTEPWNTSAVMALTVWMGYFLHGGYFTKGGAQNLVNALSGFIRNHGGEVLTSHKVDEIVVENNQVEGVRVGDTVFKAPVVVANADAKVAFLKLVGEEKLDDEFIEYIKKLKMSPSCFVVYLGVNLDLSRYPTLIKNLDEGYEIAVISNSDENLAPKGKSSVLILAGADYSDFPERGTEEYERRKKEYAEFLIRKAEKVIPGLSRHIEILDAATPKTMERYTSTPEGALYSFAQSIETKRPCFKTPIKGLYLAGASTFPGGGIEGSSISGIICANDICNWRIQTP
jgi:all-trans-retinol 13,14-reductase